MSERIELALNKLFESHRIVFWYDERKELREVFDALAISDVKKVIIQNNEFQLKYRILREEPKQKFLLYQESAQPVDSENWLLDVLLSHAEFRADQVSLWLAELELAIEFFDVVDNHKEFYKNTKRREKLKSLITSTDTKSIVRLKMISICVESYVSMDSVLEHLLEEFSLGAEDKIKLLERCNLLSYFWEFVERDFRYKPSGETVEDFLIDLFKSGFKSATDNKVLTHNDLVVFLKKWKDNRNFEKSFRELSDKCAKQLSIEEELNNINYKSVVEIDYFKIIDKKIINDLVREVKEKTIQTSDLETIIRLRRKGHWFYEFQNLYEALSAASQFLKLLGELDITINSLSEGIHKYCSSWFLIDQLYRKYIYHVRVSGEVTILSELTNEIENMYSNFFLLKINNQWQPILDKKKNWYIDTIPAQRNFYSKWVMPFLEKNNKVCVIISDAMRYEIGEELLRLIRKEDRYGADIEYAYSMLPSYTQIGMAALLPNTELSIATDNSALASVDGLSSQGTINRNKILERAHSGKAKAILAERIKEMNKEECRTLMKENNVLYIYHNTIDAVGDKLQSETKVFEAAETALKELILLIKKMAGANMSNFLVTSDHGFIYQNREIQESDFLESELKGEEILYKHRRFVIGKKFQEHNSFKAFTFNEIGLVGEGEIQFPKSILRLRLQGSGSRFVHGGTTLQEIVIPVLKINKARESDTSIVEVEILSGPSNLITANKFLVTFYQREAVSEKTQSRTLRAGLYDEAGNLISDSQELVFDINSENPREREMQRTFLLTKKADESNGKQVIFRLEERVKNTSHFQIYKSQYYKIKKHFLTEFDL